MELSKDFFVGEGWSPAEQLLGTTVPCWWFKSIAHPTEKKKHLYLDSHVFNLPVESQSIVFRWIMPKNPGLYSESWEVPEDYRMASVMRFTVGEWGPLTEHDLKEVRESRLSISKERLTQLSDILQRSFLFNGLKIPYLDVRYDAVVQSELDRFVSFYNGKTAEIASLMAQKVKDEENSKKQSLLAEVKTTLESQPKYLSILQDVVSGKVSIDSAIQITGNAVFQKGV